MLTKKDFERIAYILGVFDASSEMVAHFVVWFQEENPRFDEGRFNRAVYEAFEADAMAD